MAGLVFMVINSIPSPVRLILNRDKCFIFDTRIEFQKLNHMFFLHRLVTLCLTPMFYVMAAEKENLKSWVRSCCCKSNSVSPLNPA